jgi:hypothetical protein
MSDLVHCLQTRLHPANTDPRRFPTFLASLIRNIIIGETLCVVILLETVMSDLIFFLVFFAMDGISWSGI